MSTLLDAVNAVLDRVGLIAGDAGKLTSLTDSGRQRGIDLAVQVIGEGVDELFTTSQVDQPLGQGEGTLTLLTSIRSYPLNSDVVRLRFPMIDRTNSQYILDFAGGYNAILIYDPQQIYTGLPHYGAISPVTGQFYVDRIPTSQENGRVYQYEYDKEMTLANATDVLPFNVAVLRAMVPAWAQLWKREIRGAKEFDQAQFGVNLGRASRLLTMKEQRDHYSPRAS